MISIVIPVYNQHEMTQECIRAIIDNTDCDREIILVDNGSNPPIAGANIRNETNLGFPAAVNQGLSVAKGDTLVILNNDVIVTPGWADRLMAHLDNGWDMVGPVTNSISGPQQRLIPIYDDQAELNRSALAHAAMKAGQVTPFHRLVFYCVAMRRHVYDALGPLDEAFTPGNFEDDDYCMRAIEAGFKLGIAHDVYVHHFGSMTHKGMDIDYQALMKRNQGIFTKKWPAEKYKELSERGRETWQGAKIQ